jgi:hypothetical protein
VNRIKGRTHGAQAAAVMLTSRPESSLARTCNYWQRRCGWNYTETWPETLNALGDSPTHYGTEAKIASSDGDEVIGGCESSPREQHIAT